MQRSRIKCRGPASGADEKNHVQRSGEAGDYMKRADSCLIEKCLNYISCLSLVEPTVFPSLSSIFGRFDLSSICHSPASLSSI